MLLPIGHALGVTEDRSYRVRFGSGVVRLSEERFMVWALAHGSPDGFGDPAGVLPGLLGDGLVCSVTPGTEEATDFARRHRLRPLMLGLGNLPDDPEVFEVGLAGEPYARIDRQVQHVYLWGHLAANLLDACGHAAFATRAEPQAVLDNVFRRLPDLLGPNAACLEVA